MADLFDMRIGGAGWHLTSHLIALAALFVACFAITGYITFRDDSVPITALNDSQASDQDLSVDNVAANSLNVSGASALAGTLTVDGAAQLKTVSVGTALTLAAGTAATTLTAAQSGQTILCDFGVASSALVLPTAVVGLNYTIVLDGAANGTFGTSGVIVAGGTVAAPTQSFWGVITVQEVVGTTGAIDVGTQSVDRGTVTFPTIVLCSASTVTGGAAGDRLYIECLNAGEWCVNAHLHTTSAVAATLPATGPFDANGAPAS